MRYLVIADIHSNLAALQAVLEDAQEHGGFGHTWCLGDVVGYGPEPSACIRLLRELDPACVSGNHDQAAAGKLDMDDFNSEAARANRWTAGQIDAADREFLLSLPPTLVKDGFTLAHGSPRQPFWEYIVHRYTALDNFCHFDTPYCLVGHSHVPRVFEFDGGDIRDGLLSDGDMLKLGSGRLIINPGSVGQPRDRDPRASYIIFDTDGMTMQHYRVAYDIKATQAGMEAAGLPDFLVSRLDWGV